MHVQRVMCRSIITIVCTVQALSGKHTLVVIGAWSGVAGKRSNAHLLMACLQAGYKLRMIGTEVPFFQRLLPAAGFHVEVREVH